MDQPEIAEIFQWEFQSVSKDKPLKQIALVADFADPLARKKPFT